MHSYYHTLVTIDALSTSLSSGALSEVIRANLQQDSIIGQIFHNEYHFDNNKLAEGVAYIRQQEHACLEYIQSAQFSRARRAFGSLIHTIQDYFSHTNFVRLFNIDQNIEIMAQLEIIQMINEIKLIKSHMVHIPIDLFKLPPTIYLLIRDHLPKNSHAYMNLDTPLSGIDFLKSYQVSVRMTKNALDRIYKSDVIQNHQGFKTFLGK